MALLEFPADKIKPSLAGDVVALAERDVHQAAADLMLAAVECRSVDQLLAMSTKLIGMRAALDSAASFILAQAEDLTK